MLQARLARALETLRPRIIVCEGTGCLAKGAADVRRAFIKELEKRGPGIDLDLALEDPDEVERRRETGVAAVTPSGCQGLCQQGPLVTVEPEGYLYVGVRPEDVPDIVQAVVEGTGPVVRLLSDRDLSQARAADIDFFRPQDRRVLAWCGRIRPGDIREYLARGGYSALAKALTEMTPDEVIEEVTAAGLRGRGGAGFPTGKKWRVTRDAEGDKKYVIVNGDEGDPGAFMDRCLLEGDPHRVLEGLIIAAYAVGADEGYAYVRAEYPRAVRLLRRAMAEAERYGLLGEDILGSGFSFRARLKEGAGAFVCGEETALIASIEGRRGMPRPRPPFPAVRGLWDRPTCINNVETLGNVPDLILCGAAAYREVGTDGSPGTKIFALAGQVERTGLIEVPMGSTLRDVIFGAGGGIRGGKEFKAVQIGGPSGGCLTSEHLGLPLDYESLKEAGAMIGSGGLVVLDEDSCMVEVARFFMSFVQSESCGKCVPCREGTRRMLELLTKMTEGTATKADLDLLEELAGSVKESALCGLGKSAPNPVLTTLRYFRDEYLAHVTEHRCPAAACLELVSFEIDPEKCIGCGLCAKACPSGAVRQVDRADGTPDGRRRAEGAGGAGAAAKTSAAKGKARKKRLPYTIDDELCLRCDACRAACPKEAVRRVPRKTVRDRSGAAATTAAGD